MRLIDADTLKEKIEIECNNNVGSYCDGLLGAEILIDNAPTVEIIVARGTHGIFIPLTRPQGEWIPVSERLPDEFQRVLVTIVNYKGDKVVRVAIYYNRNGKDVFQIKENTEQWEVGEKGLLAWQPLPEPYKKGEEE